MNPSILVPWRTDGGEREVLWKWLRGRIEDTYSEWPIIEGGVPEGEPWSRSKALNHAFAQAESDVLVIIDACLWPEPRALIEGVRLVEEGATWVVPFLKVHRLSQESSDEFIRLGGPPAKPSYFKKPYKGFEGGGTMVISRGAWEMVGGWDERFKGWGGEDDAFRITAYKTVGRPVRLDYPLWHLYHSTLRTKDPHYAKNKKLLAEYRGK